MRIPVSAPFPRRWPLLGLAALLILVLVALLPGSGAVLGQSAPTVTDVAVTSDAGDDDTYILGESIRITLTFNEAVNVTGSPQLKIDMDPADWGEKQVAYQSGSGTNRLTFTHTVVEPNYSSQGIAVLENSLELNGGSIQSSSAQIDAELSHDGLAHDANHKVDWRRSPATTPTVSAVAVTSDAGDDDTYLLGETIRITLTFSEEVNVTGAPQLKIDMDPAEWGEKQAAYGSGSGTARLTFTHTVVEPNYSSQGIAVLENGLELNGGSIKSAASDTDAELSHVGLAHDPSHKVDWQRSQPNRAPVVNTGTRNYDWFIGPNNAPRGVLVSKSFYQVFTDPDGDELTYSVAIKKGDRQLLDEFSIGLDYRTPENSHRPLEVFHRVWFRAEEATDWKGKSPALADPVVVTATVTATDPEGLSVSLDGGFLIWWESHPEVVKAVASGQAIELTFDVAVSDDPGPTAGQFTVNVASEDGTAGTVSVTGVSVNGAVVTLGLGTELASGQRVTVDYAHDADTPLKRAAEGGDHAPGFTGQAVDMSLLNPLGPPQNFAVITEPGRLDIVATWDAVEGATSYKLRWRQVGGEFETANAASVSGAAIGIVTVSAYGQWEVRAQGCNDDGCGPAAAATVDVVPEASLSLERAVDDQGQVRPRTLSASWDRVEGASSYTLNWQRLGGDSQTNAQVQAQSAAGARQGRSVSGASLGSGQEADVQTGNRLTFGSDETGAEFAVPDAGAYRAEFRALNDGGELIALGHGHVNQAPGQPDTTPPWLEWGEIDGNVMILHFSESLDESATGGDFKTLINIWAGGWTWTWGGSGNVEISGNKVIVRLDRQAMPASSGNWSRYGYMRYFPPSSGEGLRDLAGNPVTALWPLIQNVTGPPHVTGIALSSDPGEDGSYASGDAIKVKVAFRKDVNVTGTPRLKIDLDPAAGGEKWADYASGSGTRNLEFAYTVAEEDFSTAGVAVLVNTLELNGGTIRGAPPGPADNARPAHIGLHHNPSHKVVTPGTALILQRASVTGTELTLTFSEALGAAASLSNDAFTVKKTPQGDSEQNVSLSGSPAISGSTVALTLSSAVLDSDAGVKVSYAKPATGTNNRLADVAGNEAENFTDEWVKNSLDTTPPRLEWGEIDGNVFILHFSEPLDETATGGLFETDIRTWRAWHRDSSSQFEVSGNKVTVQGNLRAMTVSIPWTRGAYVRYFPPASGGLRDLGGNPVARWSSWSPPSPYFSGKAITNVTGLPFVTGITVSLDLGEDGLYSIGDAFKVKVAFREDVNVTGTPRLKIDLDPADGGERWANYSAGSDTRMLEFTYIVAAADISATEGVAVLANTLELNGGAIRGAPPGPADNARLAHLGLRHNSAYRAVTPGSADPILQRASVTGTALTLVFTEPLGAAPSLSNSAFTVKKTPQGGSEQDVSLSGAPAIIGSTVTLTLASAVLDSDVGVKVSYAKPATGTNNRLVDSGGAEAAGFTDEWVLNTLDATLPFPVSGEIDGDVITLYFSEPLDEGSVSSRVGDYFRATLQYKSRWAQDGQCPLPNYSFSVRPREAYVRGNTVVLDGLSNNEKIWPNVHWTIVSFNYQYNTAVAEWIRDMSGNPVNIHHEMGRTRILSLENVTRLPYPRSATVNGSRVTLTFSAPMDRGWVPTANAFTVKVGGSVVSLAGSNPVSVVGREVTLTLASTVATSDAVTVSYAKPQSHPLRNVVCEYAPSFTDQAATNATP